MDGPVDYTTQRALAIVFIASSKANRRAILGLHRPALEAFTSQHGNIDRALRLIVQVLVERSTDGGEDRASATEPSVDAMDTISEASDANSADEPEEEDRLRQAVQNMVDAMEGVVEALGLTPVQVRNFVDALRHLRRHQGERRL
ncbi:uncharacterized protein SCHCODRAFT_02522272 [Schizophyllum commune H4-8]|nr:uncharacterized protein SCHCODRAFT_02522272 [Schizophyllum commune H4-8]KAI5836571.1 hypothetical protein SCHCODRAFT_02522272 [Schizophyllum commune H4-8]